MNAIPFRQLIQQMDIQNVEISNFRLLYHEWKVCLDILDFAIVFWILMIFVGFLQSEDFPNPFANISSSLLDLHVIRHRSYSIHRMFPCGYSKLTVLPSGFLITDLLRKGVQSQSFYNTSMISQMESEQKDNLYPIFRKVLISRNLRES